MKPRCRAAVVDAASRKLVLGQIATPVPAKGEVLIAVAAVGVNRLDLDQKADPANAGAVLGLEAAGTVVALGEGVAGHKVGDRVMALLRSGAYAEYAAVTAELALPIPSSMTFEEAAAIPEAYFTVWSNVFMDAGLEAGEILLVHGGSSGVGSAAIQIAKVMGAVVVTTAGSDEKAEFCRSLGADLAINYRAQEFEKETARFCGERGVSVILDWIGQDYLQKHLSLLGRKGRLVLIDSRTEGGGPADLGLVMDKSLRITGSLLRPRPLAEKIAIAEGIRRRLWPLLDSGALKPRISHRFPLEEAEAAHAVVESGGHKGKVVVVLTR